MSQEVYLTRQADADIDATLSYYVSQSSSLAEKWFSAALEAIALLESNPLRYAAAAENDRFPIELRQINFGIGRRLTHRLVYTIRPDFVVVYAVRHLAQADIGLDDLV